MFLNVIVLNTLNIFTDLKGQKQNIICTMDDVRGDFLRPPHGTTPAAVITIYNVVFHTTASNLSNVSDGSSIE